MAKRKLEEINAGSMADIAFLLLIFFLVTTTMDTDEGIVRSLPQKLPPDYKMEVEINERVVFEVNLNSNDQLLVESDYIQIGELKGKIREFLTNPYNSENLPLMEEITVERARQEIANRKQLIDNPKTPAASLGVIKSELSDWEDKLAAAEKVGPFRTLPKLAIISLRNDNGTSYKGYVEVQDQMQSAINELRNEWSQKVYGENFTDWNSSNDSDKEKIKVIRAIVPQRIAEQEPKNIPAY
ncbi:MAG TPA: biopolymer transporter ExbD [Flavobacteriales bacterium]|nr:biopolymer transporter ExbD [Flavobacteriales bacterium]